MEGTRVEYIIEVVKMEVRCERGINQVHLGVIIWTRGMFFSKEFCLIYAALQVLRHERIFFS